MNIDNEINRAEILKKSGFLHSYKRIISNSIRKHNQTQSQHTDALTWIYRQERKMEVKRGN